MKDTKPLPFQKEDYEKMVALKGRVLLSWEMGLGKTFGFLYFMKHMKLKRVIIVCPAGLKRQWRSQAKEHFGIKCHILYHKQPYNREKLRLAINRGEPLIINYDILEKWVPFLKTLKPQIICGDEIHMCGEIRTKRTQYFKILCVDVPMVFGLSGTPILNKPWELFPILHILQPQKYNSPFSYGMSFCDAEKSWGKWKFNGARNLDKLHAQLKKDCLIRRTMEEVLPNLPPKRRIIVPLEISNHKEYAKAEKDLISWLASFDIGKATRAMRAERWVKMTYLKRLAASLKLPSIKEWIESFLGESDNKLLLGMWHRDLIEDIYSEFKSISVVIHGGVSTKERWKAEKAILKDKNTRILIGQIKSCGVGLNLPDLTAGLGEFPWNPGTCAQFEGRVRRLTSKKRSDVYYFVAANTVEEKICDILQRKSKICDKVLDGVASRKDSLLIMDELQKELQRGASYVAKA